MPPSPSILNLANPRAVLAAALFLGLPIGHARAEDLLGLYVGGAVGQGRVEASPGSLTSATVGSTTLIGAGDFAENHSTFKLMAGIRPISIVGAELSYIDFGRPSGNLGAVPADVSLRGAAAFAVAYLPVPIVDIVVKAGLARLQNTVSGSGGFAGVGNDLAFDSAFRLERTNTNFAVGGGVQYSIGSWALRAEYERFEAAGSSPSLLSAGVTWTFF
jgi:hypothetical protein